MLFLFNKQKIYSYIIAICTVFTLFAIATVIDVNDMTVDVSAKEAKELPIYSVNTQENNVAITINCAWNADDIDKILEVLDNNNCKVTFFIVGDWVDKFPDEVKKIYERGHEIR